MATMKMHPVTDLSLQRVKHHSTGRKGLAINFWEGEKVSDTWYVLPSDLARRVGRWLLRKGWECCVYNFLHRADIRANEKAWAKAHETMAQGSD